MNANPKSLSATRRTFWRARQARQLLRQLAEPPPLRLHSFG